MFKLFKRRNPQALRPSDTLFPLRPPLPLPEKTTEAVLRQWLATVRVADAPPEIEHYCHNDFRRFVYTWGLVHDLQGTCLELGANPYFTTMLLKQFTSLDLTLANYFGTQISSGVHTQEVFYQEYPNGSKQSLQLQYHHFNIEEDPFPFSDGSFDVVLFCEIIEHLLMDPVAVIRQVKRILKPSGVLILTTPNVARLENVARLIAGENIYDPYSGYGPYGRHNREYNKHDLYLLLSYLGFHIEVIFSADVHENIASVFADLHKLAEMLDFRKDDLGQYIFVRARPHPGGGQKKPNFLYRSYPPDELENS